MATIYSAPADSETVGHVETPARTRHLHYAENLRAAAIVLVIASHCYGLAWSGTAERWFDHDPVLGFISGATAIFVFISGFFFHHVLRGRFDHAAFVTKKAQKLLPAYLAVTAMLLLIERSMGIDGLRYGSLRDPAAQFGMALLAGTGGPAMWYIPFIFDIFLLSPLFLLFLRAGTRAQAAVLGVLLVVGLLVDRSELNRVHNLAHFGFYYAFGAFCSLHRERFEAIVRRVPAIAGSAAAVAVLAAAQYRFGLAEQAGLPVAWPAAKFVYVGKIAQILLLAGIALRFADRPIAGVTTVAQWSFGLFFLHQVPLLLLRPLAAQGAFAFPASHAGLLLCATLVFAMAMAMIWLARRALGRHSRYFVGV